MTPGYVGWLLAGGVLLICAIALVLAALERRPERRQLRAAGVGPGDERLAEALATGGLAASGIVAGLGTLAGLVLAAPDGGVSQLLAAAGDSTGLLLALAAFPFVAGGVAAALTGRGSVRAPSAP